VEKSGFLPVEKRVEKAIPQTVVKSSYGLEKSLVRDAFFEDYFEVMI
jgi:hypothetical protein